MENLNNDQIEQAKDLLKRLTRLYGEKADLEIRLKDLSEKIKFEIADSCDFKNKQGEVQSKGCVGRCFAARSRYYQSNRNDSKR